MLRCWLQGWRLKPGLCPAGKREADTSKAVLLHHLFRADADRELHDHPWDFTSEILAGAYTEALPPLGWQPGSTLGPCPDGRFAAWSADDRIEHKATDLHRIHNIASGTWTLVTTGPYLRPWGFHAWNRPWVAAPPNSGEASDTVLGFAESPTMSMG
jgi:hypothetical protein